MTPRLSDLEDGLYSKAARFELPNRYVFQRLSGIQSILNGVHQSGVGLSSATIGQERAAFIDQFLGQVLPPIYRFGTGDATDASGNRSGQLDVVVEYPFAPSLPIIGASTSRLYLAEAVAAVVEVKSDLAGQWSQAIHTASALSQLQRSFPVAVSFGEPPQSRIPLFAVGYKGWQNVDTLKGHVAACSAMDGALIIEPGIYVSKRGFSATGPLALWGLVADLHYVTTSLQSATIDPLMYAM